MPVRLLKVYATNLNPRIDEYHVGFPELGHANEQLVTCWKSNASAAEVLQGSVVTCLRCGGNFNENLVAYLLQNPPVKKNWKSVNTCLRIELHVFLTHGI